jgi:hypothetical protein
VHYLLPFLLPVSQSRTRKRGKTYHFSRPQVSFFKLNNIMAETLHNGWSTPAALALTFNGITKFGKQMVQLQVGPRIQVAAAEGNKAAFGVRASIVLVFPK